LGRKEVVRANDGLPQVRQDGLVVRELPDEVLVYDLESHKAHCLNSTAAAVWRHCDGETNPADIAFRLAREVGEPIDEDVVWLALEDLGRLQLLEAPVVRQRPGLSRRDVMRKGALVTSALAVPTVFSLFVPTASASVCGATCGPGVTCAGTCPVCPAGVCVT
jgi:coenzyme PQQ synthesis protein D (PqqD)